MRLDPETVLEAYRQGNFPMADDDGEIRWYTTDPRGVLPLESFHVPGTLRQLWRQRRFEIRINGCFERVMAACMETRAVRTWINPRLIEAYSALHRRGHAHSVETWKNGELAGGLYGVSLGAAFFGESMFHHVRDASKVALVALVERLRQRDFVLLDVQTCSDHLVRFGGIEIPAKQYMARLKAAMKVTREFA